MENLHSCCCVCTMYGAHALCFMHDVPCFCFQDCQVQMALWATDAMMEGSMFAAVLLCDYCQVFPIHSQFMHADTLWHFTSSIFDGERLVHACQVNNFPGLTFTYTHLHHALCGTRINGAIVGGQPRAKGQAVI